ncbi:mechanosensitive ion channel family protein [Intestinimonas butyriciproducens]|uniref:Mechanosensitive ion channel family protein n=1 Tax=Candidatus Intestinimonas merdavium TaxID=2838622 RepID=A0A9D1Z1M0_9FIRM|nr:mechanosensitive ion channel family protein [Intestinimonas butyriciproducens]MBM6975625.1 mechanosensitive ion channel family protein [Intestinimonas butyriciproducens]HIY72424.1 mechanosensitive ion channel family protein [Candidatus Intestinimonas merdavium]
MSAELPTSTTTPEETVEVFEQVARGLTLTKALYGLLLFLGCMAVMKVILSLIDRTMTRLKVEPTVHKFTHSCLKVLMWVITGLIVAAYLDFPINSLVTVLGVIGVALSLSLQGSLSNLAGGITVMVSRPFAVGDYVEAGGVSGTVSEIGLVYTKLKTIDNKIIFIPNGEISGEKIVNYNKQEQRRVDLTFTVSYDADPERVKEIMRQVIGAHPKALFTPEPFVRTTSLGESSVGYTLRVWCATQDYWELYYDLLEQVRAAFDREGVELTYNHLNVHIMKE